MAYVAPSTVTTLQTYTSAAHNIIVNDIIDLNTSRTTAEAAWTTWTPATSGWAATFTMTEAKYIKVGRTVSFYALMTFSSAGAGSGLAVTIPVTASSANASANIQALILDNGTLYYMAQVLDSSTTAIRIAPIATDGVYAYGGSLANTTPMTWAAGDKIWFGGTYESA